MFENLQGGFHPPCKKGQGGFYPSCKKTWGDYIHLYKNDQGGFYPGGFCPYPMERTRFCDYLCYKGDNLKNTHARVMVLVHDTSSQCALQMYEVSLKYL